MLVNCEVEEITLQGDHGDVESVCATCSRCGQSEESYGTGDASINRCLVMLRQNCPRGEQNFYVAAGK